MTAQLVTVILDRVDGAENPYVKGTVTWTPSQEFPDVADQQLVGMAPVTATFAVGRQAQVKVIANDTAGPQQGNGTPGWTWNVTYSSDTPGQPAAASYYVLSTNGTTQRLSSLAQVPAAQPGAQYLPLPSGTAQAGQVPVATGSGEASAWTTLTAASVGADAAGAAASAVAATAGSRLLNDRGAIAASTAYSPGDMVAYQGQRVLITTAVTSSAWPNWFTPPTLTAGTYIPITSQAVYYAADWGVKADGATDNAAALTRALWFMSRGLNSGGFLVLPDGWSPNGAVVGVGSTVVIPPGCFIVGGGMEVSTLKLLAGANCDVIAFETNGSAAQAAIVSAAIGTTVSSGSMRNAFYSGLMNLTVHGANTLQGAGQYNYGVNMTTNPLSTAAGNDPDFDPYNLLFNVEVRSCTGDGLSHSGRGGLRVTNCLFRYNQGWGAKTSFDSLYAGDNFGQNGIGGIYVPNSSTHGAANKSYNNGTNAQWVSLTAYSALATVMYSGQMYRAINAVTSSTPPSTDTTNWAHITAATAPQYWGYGFAWDSVKEDAWTACDSQENAQGDYYLHNCLGMTVQGTSALTNYLAASNPNNVAVVTLDGSSGCIADVSFSQLNSLAYVLRSLNGATRNDVRMAGDTTYQGILSPDSTALVGSGNSVKVNGAAVSDSTAVAFTATGLAGATAASRYAGATASGAPASGTFALGDFTVDRTGGFWVCTTAGTVGSGCVFTQVSGSGGALTNPMTTLGDMIYGAAAGAAARVAGNTAATALPLVSKGNGTAAAAPSFAALPGQYLCTPSQYAPASQTTLSTTSASYAAVSSANVNTGSFTAPASGSVMVGASFAANVQTANTFIAFALAQHGTTTMTGNTVEIKPSTTETRAYSLSFLVTGLTAGTSYNLDLMFAVSGAASLQVLAIGQSGTPPTLANLNVGAPAIMTVQAV